ncbi:MAG: hypothetical protein WA860_04100 [Acidimicrobiales bacterium]
MVVTTIVGVVISVVSGVLFYWLGVRNTKKTEGKRWKAQNEYESLIAARESAKEYLVKLVADFAEYDNVADRETEESLKLSALSSGRAFSFQFEELGTNVRKLTDQGALTRFDGYARHLYPQLFWYCASADLAERLLTRDDLGKSAKKELWSSIRDNRGRSRDRAETLLDRLNQIEIAKPFDKRDRKDELSKDQLELLERDWSCNPDLFGVFESFERLKVKIQGFDN